MNGADYTRRECIVNTKMRHKYSQRARQFRIRYGLSMIDWFKLRQKQNFRCAICEAHEDSFDRALAVDHDHIKNRVRGLLCNKCNRALGLFGDSIENLERAVKYLRGYSE